ncbi:MAG: hypothetical protein ACL7BU_00895 [Candidatus Phlomobacter fragariae]
MRLWLRTLNRQLYLGNCVKTLYFLIIRIFKEERHEEGIYTGVMVATLHMTYGGVDIRQPLLKINPSLSTHWQHLQFKVCYLGVNYQFYHSRKVIC